MRLLVDECLTRALKRLLQEHSCRTAQEMGWSGKKNGELLSLAETEFDALLTMDQGFEHQENLSQRRIARLVKWEDLDFDRSLLHIRRTAWCGKIQTAKSESSETVLPIPASLLTLLKNYRKITIGRCPTTMASLLSQEMVDHPRLTKSWNITCGRSSMPWGSRDVVFTHFATHIALLLDSGATPKVVQRQLRHADARTTLEIYGHVVGDAHREAVEKVASILDCNGPKPGVGDNWIQ